ncbi:hypothetical protein [Pseudomonas protegens]|uniref:hypothetical protein n=1 Tax=Pseudomonas protegens TaxID=380021 RepID=UPI001B3155CD|nr:hypothetical protein [Pseudomonas protegens]MBP5100415.1 hypothetical protein [Pseudomonas protegens]QTU06106.1 hypothetical protein HUT25_10225 [Pseudomonas protegens]QTU12416.1 hypothetical protein HUT23_10915 [Pseudomonas protegens]QTU40206.1 hypothetical protein HUT24_21385 [Pseudomonas protegens]
MSLIEIQEGRKFVAEMLMQASHQPRSMFDERGPVETVICNLELSAQSRPADYARGIRQVIEVARHAH